MKHTNHLRIAIAAIAAIALLGLLGVPVGAYAPFGLILVLCPLMMYFMMRNMGHADHNEHGDKDRDEDQHGHRTQPDKPMGR